MTAVTAACVSAAIASPVAAQMMSISHTELRTWSPYGTGTMDGGQAMIWFPVHGRATHIRAGMSQVFHADQYMGTLCTGLIFPGSCPPELVEEKYTVLTATLGVGQQVFKTRYVQLQIFADATAGDMTPILRSIGTDATLTTNKKHIGWRAGAEAWWWPSTRLPLGLTTSVSRDEFKPRDVDMCVDCWAPLRGDFGGSRLSFGVIFGKRP